MREPVTTIDLRYSHPDAVATGWDETRRVLETAQVFWISTVRTDGRPHVTPAVAVWLDGVIHFCSGATQQKALNLRDNPHVILTTGCNHWEKGLDVMVEGDAVRITDDDRLKRLAQMWATKWDGSYQFLVRDGCFYNQGDSKPVFVFSVTPTKVYAFTRGNHGGHTRHQF
jgi:nitroimidazol reductase NimA-like FMN-containing flavoprotein (pyridoxamine 5'-phosphate oxidase superfamily)